MRRRAGRSTSLLVLLLLLSACGGGHDSPVGTAQRVARRPSTTTTTTTAPPRGRLIAEATTPVSVFDDPAATQSNRELKPGLSGQLVFLVRRIVDARWLEVDLPVK